MRGLWVNLTPLERVTLVACFLGWALDSLDSTSFNFLLPTIIREFGMTRTQGGFLATAVLLSTAVGGWAAGILADHFGRVRILQYSIAWFAICTLLCGFAQDFPQLFILRVLQGIGFGGEWAAGAVLMAEIIRPQYRGEVVGGVQSGYSIGLAGAVVLYYVCYQLFPEDMAWRAVLWAGIAPALLIVVVRRWIREPERRPKPEDTASAAPKFLQIFAPAYIRSTMLVSVISLGVQGASFAIAVWLPVFLRTERHMEVSAVSLAFLSQSVGAFVGYLLAAYACDRIGRRTTLLLFSVGCIVTTALLLLVPTPGALTVCITFPAGLFLLGIYSTFGPILSELFPTAIRGSGTAFCYNIGRAIGAFYPAVVGAFSAQHGLGVVMAALALPSYVLVLLASFRLRETRGLVFEDVQVPSSVTVGKESGMAVVGASSSGRIGSA